MNRPTLFRGQILHAIRKAAAKLGRAPSRAEFLRMSTITAGKLESHFRGFREAVRAAGLEPQTHGQRVETWTLLEDWARVARLHGRSPSVPEYLHDGKHGHATLISRFGRWSQIGARFAELVEQYGRRGEFADVLEMARRYPNGPVRQGRPRKMTTKRVTIEPASQDAMPGMEEAVSLAILPAPAVLPKELEGKKCVTATMLPVLLAALPGTAAPQADLAGLAGIRSYPDRPVMGAPIISGFMLEGLACEPVNEMGVMFAFALLARRMGFIVEALRSEFPDCEARVEVEPGRWQRVRIEFEFVSLGFRRHRHDAKECDVIVCWRHNWPDCPKHLVVIELSKVLQIA